VGIHEVFGPTCYGPNNDYDAEFGAFSHFLMALLRNPDPQILRIPEQTQKSLSQVTPRRSGGQPGAFAISQFSGLLSDVHEVFYESLINGAQDMMLYFHEGYRLPQKTPAILPHFFTQQNRQFRPRAQETSGNPEILWPVTVSRGSPKSWFS
jgi:hypothetical protein